MREIDEEERIEAIKRHIEGERSGKIYRSLGKSKSWFMKWWKRYRSGDKEWYKDLPKRPHTIHKKIDGRIENTVIAIRKSLMGGTEDSTKYSFVGSESIKFRMEELGHKSSEIPSQSTIKRIIKRSKLRVNTKERYKRVRSKGRYTLLKPEFIDEIHQIDFVGPDISKASGLSIQSISKTLLGVKSLGSNISKKVWTTYCRSSWSIGNLIHYPGIYRWTMECLLSGTIFVHDRLADSSDCACIWVSRLCSYLQPSLG